MSRASPGFAPGATRNGRKEREFGFARPNRRRRVPPGSRLSFVAKHVKKVVLAALLVAAPASAAPRRRSALTPRARARARCPPRPARPGPRCATTGATPAAARSAGATTAATGPGASARPRACSAPPWSAPTRPCTWARPTAGSTRSAPAAHVRWRYRTGEIIDSAAVLGRRERRLGSSTVTFGSGDEHIYRLRTTDAPAQPERPHGLALRGHAPAGRGPARELVGGQRDHGLRRHAVRGQHRRGRVLDRPARPPALDLPGRELGVVQRRDRRRRQRLLRLARPELLRASRPPGSSSGRPSPGTS